MGRRHTVLLQSSGRAFGLGDAELQSMPSHVLKLLSDRRHNEANKHGQCNIPEIPSNLEYVQAVSA